MNPLLNLNKILLTLNPYEFNALAVILGYIFSEGLDYNELQSMGNFFESIGQTLLTIGQQCQTLNDKIDSYDYSDLLNSIRKKVGNIDEILSDLKNLKF